MGTRVRPIDRGSAIAERLVRDMGRELREARMDRAVSARVVASAVGTSHSTILRIERGLMPSVGVRMLARIAAVVGLDLSVRVYPGGHPIRDSAHVDLLGRLRAELHPALRWRAEVPLPIAGDPRAWDAMIDGPGWRMAVEAETAPRDAQALERRLQLKLRDGSVGIVVLLLPTSRRARLFVRAAGPSLRDLLPLDGRTILERLRAGESPAGSGILLL
jgi:transcriptional regulator with XRE-family HTH domain